MIFYTVDTIKFTFFVFYNAPYIPVKFFTVGFCNCFTSIFSSKNNLDVNMPVKINARALSDPGILLKKQ